MRLCWCVTTTAATVVSVAVILVALSALVTGATGDTNLDNVFRDRSVSEWKEAWHREKYARCRQTLLRHLEWACEKDIYRITRRSSALSQSNTPVVNYPVYPVISAKEARQMLRSRRGGSGSGRRGNSITTECCTSTGCTWEEYAEYCPTNKRRINFTYT